MADNKASKSDKQKQKEAANKARDEKRARLNAARRDEADRLGFAISVRFTRDEMEQLKIQADKVKRSTSYIVREAAQSLLK